MIKILGTESVVVYRTETNFDKACDSAYRLAVFKFGIDEYGHSSNLEEWCRSNSWIEVEFKSFRSNGNDYIYTFEATAQSNLENEE